MKFDTTVGLYVTKDKVADDISPVFQAKNNAVALRMFNDLISSAPYPSDYELWIVGTLDKDMIIKPHIERIDTYTAQSELMAESTLQENHFDVIESNLKNKE